MASIRKIFSFFPQTGRKIKYLFRLSVKIKEIEWSQKYEALIWQALHSTERGVTDEIADHEVIVSLTTYGLRFYDVAATIESIMQGSMKPNRIILWLGEDMKDTDIPQTLQRQMKRGLEIEYCKDIRSYTKLIPCLKKYPEASIITIDDDVIYRYDMVENLINSHKRHPRNIISNRMHQIVLGSDGKPAKYRDWRWETKTDEVSPLNFQTGVCGVLYPPHCLDDEVFNEDVFMNICKFADDVWFYAMALKMGTCVVKTKTRNMRMGHDLIENPTVQDDKLSKINIKGNGNNAQLCAVFEKYDLYKLLLT